jgi:RimJ/RimL family protein N-acetyltransferase
VKGASASPGAVGGGGAVDGRVILRQWGDPDLGPLAEMNADPEVMRFFPKALTPEESAALMGRLRSMIETKGWGLWAVEVDGALAGFTGLWEPTFTAHFTPCVEIGWRLRREYWGRGIAYAAALQAEAYAFKVLRLGELVAMTAEVNARSRRLMERLGFRRDPADDFLHPRVESGHLLQKHVLYRKARP